MSSDGWYVGALLLAFGVWIFCGAYTVWQCYKENLKCGAALIVLGTVLILAKLVAVGLALVVSGAVYIAIRFSTASSKAKVLFSGLFRTDKNSPGHGMKSNEE